MPIQCTLCHRDKWASEFSHRDRDRAEHICKDCRAERDKDKRERRLLAELQGKRICSICHEAKDESEFSNRRESRCRSCKTEWNRRFQETRPPINAINCRGNPEIGYECSTCNTVKPACEFSTKTGRLDYRCKQCAAARAAEYRTTDHGKFMSAKGIADRRRIEWNIPKDAYLRLRSMPCHYCGHILPVSGIGLDRKDGSADYSLANVVPCCFECNIAKGSIFSYDEMLVIGKAIGQVKSARTEEWSRERGWGRPRKYPSQQQSG